MKTLDKLKKVFNTYNIIIIIYLVGLSIALVIFIILPDPVIELTHKDLIQLEMWMKFMLIICLSGVWWYFVVPFDFVLEKIIPKIEEWFKK